MIRVLHSVDTYLHISENWIYPQLVRVPKTQCGVFCESTINLESFPLGATKIIVSKPSWSRAFGVPRLLNAMAKRIGCDGTIARLKCEMWNPQLLHAHFGTRGWESLGLKRKLGIPLLTSFYGYDAWLLPERNPIWRKRYDELFNEGDVFLVEGPAMRSRLCELGCSASKVVIQRIGIDPSLLAFDIKSISEGLKIVMVGRFVEKKGLVDGLRACALARSRGVKLSVTVVGDASVDDIVGQKIKEELRAIANSPELAGLVRFTGFTPLEETYSIIRSHNIFLCPSKHAVSGDAEGGSPVVLTEAMALGLFCIGTRHCDIPEVIVDSKTGYLCEEGSFISIADAICEIDRNHSDFLSITGAGRKHVESYFSLSVQLDKLYAIYLSISSNISKVSVNG